jgi:hypothetical protein
MICHSERPRVRAEGRRVVISVQSEGATNVATLRLSEARALLDELATALAMCEATPLDSGEVLAEVLGG